MVLQECCRNTTEILKECYRNAEAFCRNAAGLLWEYCRAGKCEYSREAGTLQEYRRNNVEMLQKYCVSIVELLPEKTTYQL